MTRAFHGKGCGSSWQLNAFVTFRQASSPPHSRQSCQCLYSEALEPRSESGWGGTHLAEVSLVPALSFIPLPS